MSSPTPANTQDRISQFDAAISHPDRDVRLRAALDGGMLRAPEVTATLVSRVSLEEDFRVRENLTWALVQHGRDVLPAMYGLLTSKNPVERRQAAHVLSKMGDPANVSHIVPIVADENADVAIKAYRAAASTGSPDVVQPLVERLGHGEGEQRDALSNALQQLGVMTVEALIDALRHSDAAVRTHAAEALAQIGEQAGPATTALAEASADQDLDVALAAVMALGALGTDESDAALLSIERTTAQPLSAVARRLLNSRPAI